MELNKKLIVWLGNFLKPIFGTQGLEFLIILWMVGKNDLVHNPSTLHIVYRKFKVI